jgi:hypothetical protein
MTEFKRRRSNKIEMTKIEYKEQNFNLASREALLKADSIIKEYLYKGYKLTLRQLFYQFVARGYIENTKPQYDRLSGIINNGRLAGWICWAAIEDRTRHIRNNAHWDKPQDILESAAHSFKIDKWAVQKYRPEVWIEKDALIGVLESVCPDLDVPYFSCRGYVSASETWRAGQRFSRYIQNGQIPVIFHLGDHDPSGIDMTRDIWKRINVFTEYHTGHVFDVIRLALNMDQVEEIRPPPNPTKLSDARAGDYIAEYGPESWELDALEPEYIANLVRDEILQIRDENIWNESVEYEEKVMAQIHRFSQEWDHFFKQNELF